MTHDRTCELALPAGSLQCALYAFKGGADAVYFGLKSFSARKGAVNFSFEDVRKVKAYCVENGKKFYITLNTLVKDSDIPQVVRFLKQLDFLAPDGVIVQDLGIAKLMRERFPGNVQIYGINPFLPSKMPITTLLFCSFIRKSAKKRATYAVFSYICNKIKSVITYEKVFVLFTHYYIGLLFACFFSTYINRKRTVRYDCYF